MVRKLDVCDKARLKYIREFLLHQADNTFWSKTEILSNNFKIIAVKHPSNIGMKLRMRLE